MAPLRCIGLQQIVLSDDGRAVLLELSMANGKTFPLELEAGGVDLLMRALVAAAQGLGGAASTPREPLASVSLDSAVMVPAEALTLRPAAAGGLPRLLVRLGSVDLNVAVPDADSARALAAALRDAT